MWNIILLGQIIISNIDHITKLIKIISRVHIKLALENFKSYHSITIDWINSKKCSS